MAERLRFIREGERPFTVEIAPAALRVLSSFRQVNRGDLEAGGVLLGRLIEESDDVVIDEVGEPTDRDRRSRTFFHRARRAAQRIVDRAWRKSGGTRVYLGEWHSHPEPVPHPSGQDLSDWVGIVRNARFEHGFLLFIVVGTTDIRAWIVERGTAEVRALERHEPWLTSAMESTL